ncbi:DUF6297 family protein [Cellulomonas fimi]|uniref:ABC-2 type transport system permease protein n=1 Tax=Cellulomonas fimi (strain ATCC 484 / DSM 20113 / JCM 1341 / CCUG 24087 / LMG 16345 / NBRC 15513 / NCIMB 8980 / NCTC 7547 / NRS-133) TaxID=590998 RepID=F4H493_CELFA|nr:DUF6297 family protein [Cellulomonas fimi]AEE46569.1 hypothetical protein Celf_2443 [Cellulomonas fimi ATCC 484]NNH08525.1 hypothetical protein [Cellulomonas fimi]VEH33523.1 Uncharacterised protein [Cellulomonas fimi]
MTDEVAVAPADVGEVPGARAIRRYTAQAGNARGGASLGTVLSDVYYAVISVALSVLFALGAVRSLRLDVHPSAAVETTWTLELSTVVAVVLGAGAGALLSVAGRLGPVASGGAEAAWWLGLPVDRRGLLRPASLRPPLLAAAVGGVVLAVLDAGLLGAPGGTVLRVALAGALLAAAVVLAAALAQSAGAARRSLALAGDLVALAAAATALVLLVLDVEVPAPSPPWVLVVALAVGVAALGALVDRRLGDVPARSLRESGSVAAQAVGAVVSFDSRELGRALTDGALPAARRRASRLRTVRGPATALVTADLVVLRRSTRHLVQLVVAALVPAAVVLVPQLAGPPGVLLALLLAGYAAASATGEGARRAEMAPVLDRLLPLDARTVRRLRMVVPGAVMLLWSLAAFAAVGVWAGRPVGWLALAVASAPVWAAAAVRAAYRSAPDWSGPLVSTPAGALPGGVAAVLARGPDVVVLGLLPVWIAVLVGRTGPVLLGAQLLFSVVAVLVASSTETRPLMERVLDAQETPEPRR